MTTIAHAWHQFRFDLLRMRWWLAAYVALIVVPLLLLDTTRGTFTSSVAVFTVALAMLAAATMVQGDAPLDVRAFWRGKPMSPVGLGVAKLLFSMVLLVGAPVLVLGITLWINDIATDERSAMLRAATADTLQWISVALAIAAVSRDRKTAPLLLLAALLAGQMVARSKWGVDPLRIGYFPLQAITILGAVGLLILTYARALPRRAAVALAMLIAMLGTSTFGRSAPIERSAGAGLRVTRGPESMRVFGTVLPTAQHAVSTRYVLVDPQPGTRYIIRNAKITMHFADRGPLTVGAHSEAPLDAGTDFAGLPAGVRMVGLDSARAIGDVLSLDGIDWYDRLPHGTVTRVEMVGELHRYRPLAPRILPWRTGRAFSERGRALHILPPDTSRSRGANVIELTRLAPSRSADASTFIRFADRDYSDLTLLASFVLIDRARGEAMSIRGVGSGLSSALYILPGVSRTTRSTYLEGPAPRNDSTGAAPSRELLLQEWEHHSYTPVQLSFTTTPLAPSKGALR